MTRKTACLVCYEMSHDKGLLSGHAIVWLSALTSATILGLMASLKGDAEKCIVEKGCSPTGGIIFRSAMRLDD